MLSLASAFVYFLIVFFLANSTRQFLRNSPTAIFEILITAFPVTSSIKTYIKWLIDPQLNYFKVFAFFTCERISGTFPKYLKMLLVIF